MKKYLKYLPILALSYIPISILVMEKEEETRRPEVGGGVWEQKNILGSMGGVPPQYIKNMTFKKHITKIDQEKIPENKTLDNYINLLNTKILKHNTLKNPNLYNAYGLSKNGPKIINKILEKFKLLPTTEATGVLNSINNRLVQQELKYRLRITKITKTLSLKPISSAHFINNDLIAVASVNHFALYATNSAYKSKSTLNLPNLFDPVLTLNINQTPVAFGSVEISKTSYLIAWASTKSLQLYQLNILEGKSSIGHKLTLILESNDAKYSEKDPVNNYLFFMEKGKKLILMKPKKISIFQINTKDKNLKLIKEITPTPKSMSFIRPVTDKDKYLDFVKWEDETLKFMRLNISDDSDKQPIEINEAAYQENKNYNKVNDLYPIMPKLSNDMTQLQLKTMHGNLIKSISSESLIIKYALSKDASNLFILNDLFDFQLYTIPPLEDIAPKVAHRSANKKKMPTRLGRWQRFKKWIRQNPRQALFGSAATVGAAGLASWMAYKKGWVPTNTIRKITTKIPEKFKPWRWKWFN